MVFGSAVIVVIVAVGNVGRLVGDLCPIAVLVRFVGDDLLAAVGEVNRVLASGLLVLVSLAARLLVAVVVVDVELESVVVPSLSILIRNMSILNKQRKPDFVREKSNYVVVSFVVLRVVGWSGVARLGLVVGWLSGEGRLDIRFAGGVSLGRLIVRFWRGVVRRCRIVRLSCSVIRRCSRIVGFGCCVIRCGGGVVSLRSGVVRLSRRVIVCLLRLLVAVTRHDWPDCAQSGQANLK